MLKLTTTDVEARVERRLGRAETTIEDLKARHDHALRRWVLAVARSEEAAHEVAWARRRYKRRPVWLAVAVAVGYVLGVCL